METLKPGVPSASWAKVAVLSGIGAAFCYFSSVVTSVFPLALSRVLFFAIGPLSVVSALGVYHAIRSYRDSIALQVGILLLVIAGVLVNVMAVVQASQFTAIGRQIQEAPTEAAKETLTRVLWGVNTVQAGLDVSWDIFIALGTAALAIALMRHPRFGLVIGWVGVAVSLTGLRFNLSTFPTSPAEAGLVDLGPAVGLWYVVVLLQLLRSLSWIKTSSSG